MKTEGKDDWGSRRHLHVLELMAFTALGLYLCYRISLPFMPALAWALALAVVFRPVHRWLLGRMKRSTLAASISVVAIGLIVILPATFMGQRLISEAIAGAENVRVKIDSGEWQRELDAHPRVAPLVRRIVDQIDLPATVGTIGAWLTAATASLVKGSVVQGIEVLLTFYFLFYFLRDQPAALSLLRSLSPLSPQQMTTLFNRVADTVYATV